jgi:hypothetical protein
MTPEYEQKLVRACLAAIARRTGVGLVVTDEAIEHEYENDTKLDLVCDAVAKCVRISVPEVRP